MRTLNQLFIKWLSLPAIAMCSLLVFAGPSKAADITFLFTGAVLDVPDVLHASPGSLGVGPMTGSITFDSTVPEASPGSGNYLNAIKATTTLTIPTASGTYTASWVLGGTNLINIDNSSPGGVDRFFASSSMTGATINGAAPSFWTMSLIDSNGTVFSDENLPTTPPSLSSFGHGEWRLFFDNGKFVQGAFSTLTAVPLPPAVILFGAGLVALIGLGARNWQRAQA